MSDSSSSSSSGSSSSTSSSSSSSSDSIMDGSDARQGQAPQRLELHDAESDEDYDSDSSAEIITSFIPNRPMRPLPKRSLRNASASTSNHAPSTKPMIVVLDEQT